MSVQFVITGVVKAGPFKDMPVCLYRDLEDGGCWQWGFKSWAHLFGPHESNQFNDAIRCAFGATTKGKTCGPKKFKPSIASIMVRVI